MTVNAVSSRPQGEILSFIIYKNKDFSVALLLRNDKLASYDILKNVLEKLNQAILLPIENSCVSDYIRNRDIREQPFKTKKYICF
jgi:hypothetical protein